MGNVQPNYNVAPDIGFEGQIADMRFMDIISRIAETGGSIGFGKAVIRGTTASEVKLGAGGKFVGLTVRDITLPASNSDAFLDGNSVPVMVKGTMFAIAKAAVTFGDPVYYTSTGTLTNVKGTRTAAFGTQVGNGDGTLPSITVDATNPPDIGNYQLRFYEAATNLGYYEVIKLDDLGGNVGVLGIGKVGVAFNNGGLSFTIPDGGTDWALGTTVAIAVSGGNTLIPGARWEKSVAQDALSIVRLN